VPVLAQQAPPASANDIDRVDQDQIEADRKVHEERQKRLQSKDVRALAAVVDAALASGDAALPSDFPIAWSHDYFKARNDQTYVPYTLSFPQAATTAASVVMYLRLVRRGVPAPVASAVSGEPPSVPSARSSELEDAHVIGIRKPIDPLEPYRLSRALVVDGGEFDAYVAIRELGTEPAKTSVLAYALTVPDLTSDLAASSMLLNPRIAQLAAPLSPLEQESRPYALGSVELTPAWSTKLTKSDTLTLFLFIYNAQLVPENGKPDVVVDYNFYSVIGGTERFFNKTNPQEYSAETMPPQWDASLGHQLNVGLAGVPLTSFPLGSYRLEVKVTDKRAGTSVTRDLLFDLAAGS
jgi:hypothetical protein